VIKKKVMDRVYVVEQTEDLLNHIDKESLLEDYGGDIQYSLEDWFKFIQQQGEDPKEVEIDLEVEEKKI